MPIISIFFGMMIRVFHADHPPPHIHVQYGEFQVIVEIKTGRVLEGKFPKHLKRLLDQWLKLRRKEILRAWNDAQEMRAPRRVKPME